MPKVMLSGRVEDGLRRWVTAYAIERGVSRTAVLEWALREARALAKAGVPDLLEPESADGRSVGVGRVRRAGSRATSSPGAPAVSSRPAAGAPASSEAAGLARLAAGPEVLHPEPASVADVVTGTGPDLAGIIGELEPDVAPPPVGPPGLGRPTARAVPEAVRARQERLNKAKGMR